METNVYEVEVFQLEDILVEAKVQNRVLAGEARRLKVEMEKVRSENEGGGDDVEVKSLCVQLEVVL